MKRTLILMCRHVKRSFLRRQASHEIPPSGGMTCGRWLFSILIITCLLPGISHAFSPETDCPAYYPVSSYSDIKTALDPNTNVYPQKSPDGTGISYDKGDKYVICLKIEGQYPSTKIDKTLQISGRDKDTIIYGLNITPTYDYLNMVLKPADILLSITDSNISLYNAKINNTEYVDRRSKTALAITGSHVKIIDSTINASEKGIVISGGNDITIQGTRIYGNKTDGCSTASAESLALCSTKGIEINSTSGVMIMDNLDGIENTDIGIFGPALVSKTTFKNVTIPIMNEGPMVEVVDASGNYKVGKMLDVTGQYTTYIGGLAPVETCSADPSDESDGHVELYVVNKIPSWIPLPNSICEIEKQDANKRFCLYSGNGENPVKQEDETDEQYEVKVDQCIKNGNCYCYTGELCLFHCRNIPTSITDAERIAFAYTSNKNITYQLSEYNLQLPYNIIATIQTISDPGSTTGAGMTGGDENEKAGETGGSSAGGTENAGIPAGGSTIGGGNAPITAPLSGAPGMTKMGCSLVHKREIDKPTAKSIPVLIFMTTLIGSFATIRIMHHHSQSNNEARQCALNATPPERCQ